MNRWAVLKFFLAWIPLGLFWALLLLSYNGSNISPAAALESAVLSMGTAALLGLGVWRICGALPWPERVPLRFYGVHLVLALAYGATWQGMVSLFTAVETGRTLLSVMSDQWNLLGWRILTGVCLYGLVAGTAYAMRIRAQLGEQEAVAARAEAFAAKARLEALRAQLNPHFLFNALHSVSALVRNDPHAAEHAVDRLGGLLRYALDGGVDERVELEEEWAFTQDYLEIERLRFEDRVQVRADISAGALSFPVPPFTLQPLVENALRHGLAPRPAGGSIEVSAAVAGQHLVISVADDGVGAGPDAAERLSGFGLRGLRQRLATLYGNRADVWIDSAPDQGFRVTLSLPA